MLRTPPVAACLEASSSECVMLLQATHTFQKSVRRHSLICSCSRCASRTSPRRRPRLATAAAPSAPYTHPLAPQPRTASSATRRGGLRCQSSTRSTRATRKASQPSESLQRACRTRQHLMVQSPAALNRTELSFESARAHTASDEPLLSPSVLKHSCEVRRQNTETARLAQSQGYAEKSCAEATLSLAQRQRQRPQ